MNNHRAIVIRVVTLFLGLVVGAASAADVLKYGVTFESAANGVSNDFAYAVGDNMVGGYWYWDMDSGRSFWYPNDYSYNGVADGYPYGWFAGGEDDESKIIARTDAAGGQALQLNTDAGTLTNRLQKSVANEITAAIVDGGCAYIETEIKFIASDTLDAGIVGGYGGYRSVKSASNTKLFSYYYRGTYYMPYCSTSPLFVIYAFMDEEVEPPTTSLVVFHGVMDANGAITYTNEVFSSAPIDASCYDYTASRYTKLRIEMRQLEDPLNPGAKYNAFSVSVDDGAPLSSPTALDARFGGTATGTWFMTVEDRSLAPGNLLSSLNFRHCGEIDNIKVGVMTGTTPPPYDPVSEEPASPAPNIGLDYNRCHDGAQYNATNAPFGWQRQSVSNYVAHAPNGRTWKAHRVGLGTTQRNTGGAIDESIGMTYPTLYFQNLPFSEMPFIQSPKLEGGVGTIDFRSILLGSTVRTSELTLQVAYTDGEPAESDWSTVAVYGYGTENGNVFSRINHVVLNDYGITYVRIVRSDYNIYNPADITSGRLAVDNICITKPAADVGIVEKLRNPGYPAAGQNILMRCAVTNCVETTPATNRHVSVKYQYVARDTHQPVADAAAWSSAEMSYQGKDENGLDWYEGVIPAQRVGYVWYYYQVDYDGYNYGVNPLTGGSESVSPAYWDAGTDTHNRPVAGARFEVRPYRSRYARVALDASPAEASVADMTLVGDEQWQTVIPVRGLQTISSTFVGYGYYEDDAADYEATPVVWGENNPGKTSAPPVAGFLESSHGTAVTNTLVVRNEDNYVGYYMYRFHSNDKVDGPRYDYIVKKAVYQDFDKWTASPDHYEYSLDGLPTLLFAEDFDGNLPSAQSGAVCVTNSWNLDEYAPGDYKREDFQNETPSNLFSARPVMTGGGFLRTGSRILVDRVPNSAAQTTNKTVALALDGQIENTGASVPYGLEKVTFKARASVADDRFAIYDGGTCDLSSYGSQVFVNATWSLTDMAPSKPYFSYIFLYRPATEDDGASWYEVRIVQADSINANNSTVLIELWRRDPTASESVLVAGSKPLGWLSLAASHAVNVRAYNDRGAFSVNVSFSGNTSYHATVVDKFPPPGRLLTGGKIGFGVFDAVPCITAVKAGTSNGGTDILPSLGETWGAWSHGGRRPDGQYRWNIQAGSITRAVMPRTIGIYAVDCSGGEFSALPGTETFVASREISSVSMAVVTVDFRAWNNKFVQIRYEGGEGDLVVDDIWYLPWRAKTRCDIGDAVVDGAGYREWTTMQQQDKWLDSDLGSGDSMSNHWAVLEGWTAYSGAFRIGANLERSRANTNLVQGVVSPVLENGIGPCGFSYAVSGGRVVYGVERTDEDDGHSWTPMAVFANLSGDSGERYVGIGEHFAGRIRVRVYGSAAEVEDLLLKNPGCGYDPAWGWTEGEAKLLLDNLRVKDHPEDVEDVAWRAYNLLITDNAPDGQIYCERGKSCFFNNSPTNGVYGAEEFDADDPYLESPPLRGVGIGEIALQYCLVPGTADAGTDGHLVIKAAPSRDTPIAEWTTITNLAVSAAGTAFVKFDDETILNQTNFVVRFYNSREAGTPRIVIDNVLVAAPALGGNAGIPLWDPAGNAITNENVLAWIARYGVQQSDLNALTMNQFNEDFLLNLDITKTCRAELRITSFQVEDDTITLGVQLTRTEDGTTVGTRAINGRVRLLGGANLADDSFSVLDANVDNGDFGDGNSSGLEYELPDSNPPAFFKIVVE
jgi:hypothetical protein